MLDLESIYIGKTVPERNDKVKTIYIKNLNYKITEKDLSSIFGRYGKVQKVTLMMKPGGKHKNGMAFIQMQNRKSALSAIESLNGKKLDGRTVTLNFALTEKKEFIPKDKKEEEKEKLPIKRRKRTTDLQDFLNEKKKWQKK